MAPTERGLANGLYAITRWLGVHYIHPEQTALSYGGMFRLEPPVEEWPFVSIPRFSLRGFHEHTQHPTVWSDYFLDPTGEGYRDVVSRYLLWLARNQQNQFTFHISRPWIWGPGLPT